MAIDLVETVFSEEMRFSMSRTFAPTIKAASQIAAGVRLAIFSVVRTQWRRSEKRQIQSPIMRQGPA
jgi:uncharacterized protein YqfA (UPF0365 family)